MEEGHSEGHEHHKKNDFLEKARKNPWMIATFALTLILIVIMFSGFSFTGNVISADAAGKKVLNFAQGQVAGDIDVINVNELSGLYEVNLLYNGETVPLYVTKDGKNLVQGVVSFDLLNTDYNSNTQVQEVPQTEKPSVELFVMSYCPYGTQAEKGILPVVAELGDSIDFKLRMVHYVLHGEKEDIENKRQICIREEQGQDILNKYLVCILDSDDPNNPNDVSVCEMESGVDSAKLQTCMDSNAEAYFNADSVLSQGYGVRGSPTLIVNGVESSSGRSPNSYLQGICAAFTDEARPVVCDATLSTASPSAGFGYREGTDTIAQC